MASAQGRTISIIDAARMIFRTRTPNDKQIHRVYQLMKVGALKVRDFAGPPLRWTTTETALADFLASRREERMVVQRAASKHLKPHAEFDEDKPITRLHEDDGESEKLRVVYRNIWRDYFLAVMLRRRMEHRSQKFGHAVVVGQVVLLVTLVALMLGGLKWTYLSAPREHAPIERLIAESTDDYSIKQWYPAEPAADGTGSVVRVEYRYQKESNRWVHTDRQFLVANDQATEMSAE